MKNNIATLSNNVLTGCYELGMVEMRLVFQFVSLVNNSKKEREKEVAANRYYSISAEDYAELYGVPLKVAKIELKQAVTSLFEKDFTYEEIPSGKVVKTRWVSSVRYDKDSHEVELAWAIGILPHIHNLQANFTSYRMKYIAELPSAYSFRWYTLFLMELNKNSRNLHFRARRAEKGNTEIAPLEVEYSIEELRKMFVLEDKYSVIADLKKRVIERPIEAMMEHGQCNISVVKIVYVKSGKVITGVKFSLKFIVTEEQDRLEDSIEKCKKERKRLGLEE